MNKTRKIPKTILTATATYGVYSNHINKKELIWKNRSYPMKKLNTTPDSSFIVSTALCIELAPSAPLKAKPGPNIPHNDEVMITIKPHAMAAVVVAK